MRVNRRKLDRQLAKQIMTITDLRDQLAPATIAKIRRGDDGVAPKTIGRLVVLLCFTTPPNVTTYEYVRNFAKHMKEDLLGKWGDTLAAIDIGAGNIYDNLYSFSNSYQQAQVAMKRVFLESKSNTFCFWEQKSNTVNCVWDYPYRTEKELISAMLEGDREESIVCLERFSQECDVYLPQASPENICSIYMQLLNMICHRVNEHELSFSEIIHDTPPFDKFLSAHNNYAKLREGITDTVVRTVDLIVTMNNRAKTTSYTAVKKAVAFIEEHYSAKITLEQVAGHVHLNTSCFSVLFKAETGVNFITYIKKRRMDRARELLRNTDEKIYAISAAVGYENPNYFTELPET